MEGEHRLYVTYLNPWWAVHQRPLEMDCDTFGIALCLLSPFSSASSSRKRHIGGEVLRSNKLIHLGEGIMMYLLDRETQSRGNCNNNKITTACCSETEVKALMNLL